MKKALIGHALVAVGVPLAVIGGTQGWWGVRLGETVVHLSETTAATAGMLALAVAIGWLLWATQGRLGRRIVGIVIAVVGALMVAYALRPPRPSAEAVAAAGTRTGSSAAPVLELGAWPWAYAGAGCLIAVGALLLAVAAPPRRRGFDRYRRGHHDAAGVTAGDEAAQVWRAMDAGYDPTATPGAGGPTATPGAGAPDNQNPAPGGNLGEDRRE